MNIHIDYIIQGLKLSVGQKQRLNIIRGILLDKEIYVLDEPTSNLDKETEKLILKKAALEDLQKVYEIILQN